MNIESFRRHCKLTAAGALGLATVVGSGCATEAARTGAPVLAATSAVVPTPKPIELPAPTATATATPGSTKSPEATPVIVADCKVNMFGMGFLYAKDPDRVGGNRYLMDTNSYQVPGMPDFSRAILTTRMDPNNPNSPVLQRIPLDMSPVGDHYEANEPINVKSNDKNGKAVTFEISMDKDYVVDPRTKKRPFKALTVDCNNNGWFYVGKSARPEDIDTLVSSSTIKGVKTVGNRIQEIMLGKFKYNPNTATTNDSAETILGNIKNNKEIIKTLASDIKKYEKTNAEPVPTGTNP